MLYFQGNDDQLWRVNSDGNRSIHLGTGGAFEGRAAELASLAAGGN
jgi:hypothetical protein